MAETLRLEIITPQAIVVSEDVNMVTLPGVEGQLGIYPQHVRLITQIVPGEVIVNKDAHESSYAVGEGLVEIGPTHVAIVTDMFMEAVKGVGTGTGLIGFSTVLIVSVLSPRPLKL